MKRKSIDSKAGRFLGIYFAVITLILLWNLFHCTEVSWLTRDAFCEKDLLQEETDTESGSAAAAELVDDHGINVYTGEDGGNGIKSGARLRGVALLGYSNANGLRFLNETVSAQVRRADSGEVLGESIVHVRNQSPYPADETMMYMALSEPVSGTAEESLEISFSSEGLKENGIYFSGEEQNTEEQNTEERNTEEQNTEERNTEEQNTEEENVEEQESGGDRSDADRVLMARLFYEKKNWRPLSPILYFLLEAAAGLFCMMLYRQKYFPLFIKKGVITRSEREDGGGKPGSEREGLLKAAVGNTGEKRSARASKGGLSGRTFRRKDAAILAAVLGVFLFSMLFTWIHTLGRAARQMSAEILVPQGGDEEMISLEPGSRILQTIVPGQDRLSGIGVRFEETPSEGLLLTWRILNADGSEELAAGSAQPGQLMPVSQSLAGDAKSQELEEAAGKYVLLPLDKTIEKAGGESLLLELAAEAAGDSDTGESGQSDGVSLYIKEKTNGQIRKMRGESEESRETGEVCLLGVYSNNGFLAGFFVRLCVIVLLLLTAIYAACRLLRLQTAALYMVCALSMGMIFSFMTPPYTVSDERTHIDTVYIVSNRLLGITDVPGPEKIWKRSCDVVSSLKVTMPVTAERYREVDENLFGPAPESEKTACYARTSIENVSILCFLPSAVGFSLARLLGRNLITMIMFARWINLFTCVLIIYFAVRRMPYGAAALAVIGLFPKTLQQMASCSYDGIVISGTFLFLSYCLAAAFDEEVSITDILVFFLSGFFVASSKGGAYLPVLGLALLIPFARRKDFKTGKISDRTVRIWDRITAGLLGGSAVLFLGKFVTLIFGMFTRSSGSVTSGAGEQMRTLYTLSDFIHAPDKLIHIYLNTVNIRGDGLIGELVGKNLSQRWFIVYAFLFLAFLGMLRTGNPSGESVTEMEGITRPADSGNHIGIRGRLWILFLAACSCMLVFLSMLIAFTTKGSMFIEGLQGRYFLPAVPLFFLAAENGALKRDGLGDRHILYCAAVLLAVTFSQILLYYFGGI